jgi:hypothetical protein
MHSTTPAFDAVVRRDSTVGRGVAPSGGVSVTSYEQAQAYLHAHGVKGQRLETWGDQGEWKFSCSIPNRQNPYISRNYEGRAADYISAMRAVIEQIQKER